MRLKEGIGASRNKKTGQKPVEMDKNYRIDNEGNNENNDDSGAIIAPVGWDAFGTMCLLSITFVWLSFFSYIFV
ncbi:hypothetical protein [Serratia plymuthica]|nr:hypothetical protein [Serratia plymuthica]